LNNPALCIRKQLFLILIYQYPTENVTTYLQACQITSETREIPPKKRQNRLLGVFSLGENVVAYVVPIGKETVTTEALISFLAASHHVEESFTVTDIFNLYSLPSVPSAEFDEHAPNKSIAANPSEPNFQPLWAY